ncbi:polysaccharide biosynthesis/export family protein [Fulvivirgaceae bacterium BMA10]|uniref:Polysaccharide biosynthesis/export family protein n=1 Tax=Splendidivirga corallicola TaxID=3051826 RepID=A0ABT8KT17_9BACT|nr:polysaccharide biosynthesis/export family protein [Fulvivirgaceae bacterium BMA10]
MKKVILSRSVLIGAVFLLGSCNSYRQNIMFSTEQNVIPEGVEIAVSEAEGNYIIQENDLLNIDVYTSNGERIIDPDFELSRGISQAGQSLTRPQPNYLVESDGTVKLPLVGSIELAGITLREASELLQQRFAAFYESPFVTINYINKRVIVLGANTGTVVPLINENTTLVEVLALAGGLNNNAKAHNLRLIRGDLSNPEVYIIDLSTINGMKNSIKKIYPGDIIYIEPVRRPISESVRDIAPVISIITSAVALIITLNNL